MTKEKVVFIMMATSYVVLRFLSYDNSGAYLFSLLGAIEKLIMMSTSYDMVKLCRDAEHDVRNKDIETSFVVGDEEFLPIKERYPSTSVVNIFVYVEYILWDF